MNSESPEPDRELLVFPPSEVPTGWTDVQQGLAGQTGLSMLLVNGHQPPALAVSHNNSLCRAFQSSRKHAALCEPYCGSAHRLATGAQATINYRCHAGLHCFAKPVQLDDDSQLAVIGGRAFLKTADYRD